MTPAAAAALLRGNLYRIGLQVLSAPCERVAVWKSPCTAYCLHSMTVKREAVTEINILNIYSTNEICILSGNSVEPSYIIGGKRDFSLLDACLKNLGTKDLLVPATLSWC